MSNEQKGEPAREKRVRWEPPPRDPATIYFEEYGGPEAPPKPELFVGPIRRARRIGDKP